MLQDGGLKRPADGIEGVTVPMSARIRIMPTSSRRAAPGRAQGLARWGAALALLGGLSGCGPQPGDLGRPKPNAMNDEIMPAIGNFAARQRGEPVSGYSFTDAEREMRQLGYALIMPTHPLDRWNQYWSELRRTRIGDPVRSLPDPRGYCETLARQDYRSSKSRFIRMVDDMRADRSRIPPFCAKALEVANADRVREGALGYIANLSAVEIRSAQDRIEENRMIVSWVRYGLAQHAAAYRCALNTQLIATPEPEAVLAERELAALEVDIARMDEICGGGVVVSAPPLVTK
jgi:hypothetical protein